MSGVNPFLGPKPYGRAEGKRFFGRAAATERLTERIDLHPLTILSSPSGLGKTSLLRAAVLPELERRGLSPVYLRPDPRVDSGEDAAASLLDGRLAEGVVSALLPDPAAELAGLRLALGAAPAGVTLGGARDWFKDLPATDPAVTELLSPPEGALERLPMLARFLDGSLALEAIAAQLRLLGIDVAQPLSAATPLDDLQAVFADIGFAPKVAAARDTLRNLAGASGPDDLRHIFGPLCGIPDPRRALLARSDGDSEFSAQIVLVLDQFEQVFTLGRNDSRGRVFQMLADLLAAQAPAHIVLSLRKEWYADLVQQFTPYLRLRESLERSTFYLEPMTRREAREVMVEAPRTVAAAAIQEAQREALWQALQQDGTIDAVVLSVACHELFEVGEVAIREADVEALLRAYLSRAVEAIADEADRAEAFDILDEIAGVGGTRSFVTHRDLIDAPLRDRERRVRVLDTLQKAFLVKGDSPRHGFDKVYDIMHERLLIPLRELVATRPEISRFREAARRIVEEDTVERGLNWEHCQVLLAAGRRAVWNSRAAGVLVSSLVRELDPDRLSALQHDTGSEGLVPPGVEPVDWLRGKFREFAEASARAPDAAEFSIADRRKRSWWMTAKEIADRAAASSDPQSDELALLSGLQGPAGWMRREMAILARRGG